MRQYSPLLAFRCYVNVVEYSSIVWGEEGAGDLRFSQAWDGETRPCRSGNCAPTSLTLRGVQMDLGPPGFFWQRSRCGASRPPPHVDLLDDRPPAALRRQVLLAAGEPQPGPVARRAGPLRAVSAAPLAGTAERAAGRLPGGGDQMARCVGGVHGGLCGQQRLPFGGR